MNRALRFVCQWLISVFALHPALAAQSIVVRHVEGTQRGYLSLHTQDGKVVAEGDATEVAHGSTVTSHVVLHFRDGSLDDETTVFSERGTFRLISYHHIQTGPAFPKPSELTIDVAHGQVTSKTKDKDGKDQVRNDQMQLPADLANGLISVVAKNVRPETPETKVPMLVLTPKPRVVTLAFSPVGEEPYSVLGLARKALHYQIKFELGGVAGVVAPLVGKQPPTLQLWIEGGEAPTFLREQGPLFEDGPIWTMQLVSPDWPDVSGK